MNRANRDAAIGNTKSPQGTQVKHHMITLKSDGRTHKEIIEILKEIADKWAFQKEAGDETGYEHFQLYCMSKKKMRMSELKKLFGDDIHCEKTSNIKAAILYCQKADTRIDGPWIKGVPRPLDVPEYEGLYQWQKDVVDLCDREPDNRTINWLWDDKGCSGKTTLCKYLVKNHEALFVSGKKNDILYVCAENDSPVYLFGFTRSNEGYVSYDAIESIKDGLYFAGKYESKSIARNSPHIFCFANFPPDTSALSADRWVIKNL